MSSNIFADLLRVFGHCPGNGDPFFFTDFTSQVTVLPCPSMFRSERTKKKQIEETKRNLLELQCSYIGGKSSHHKAHFPWPPGTMTCFGSFGSTFGDTIVLIKSPFGIWSTPDIELCMFYL